VRKQVGSLVKRARLDILQTRTENTGNWTESPRKNTVKKSSKTLEI
jgi:hypothetical protein